MLGYSLEPLEDRLIGEINYLNNNINDTKEIILLGFLVIVSMLLVTSNIPFKLYISIVFASYSLVTFITFITRNDIEFRINSKSNNKRFSFSEYLNNVKDIFRPTPRRYPEIIVKRYEPSDEEIDRIINKGPCKPEESSILRSELRVPEDPIIDINVTKKDEENKSNDIKPKLEICTDENKKDDIILV